MQSSPLPAIMTCVKSVLHVLFICLLGAVSLYMKKVPGDMFKFFIRTYHPDTEIVI